MRAEFSKSTKRAALERSNGFCEARGDWYGFGTVEGVGLRCFEALRHGVEFDHVILEANSHDNSLENCLAVCTKCHRYKTTKRDIPLAAKTLRQQDKARGIGRKSTFPGSRSSPFKKRMDGTVVRR